jgi:hypothetical protein
VVVVVVVVVVVEVIVVLILAAAVLAPSDTLNTHTTPRYKPEVVYRLKCTFSKQHKYLDRVKTSPVLHGSLGIVTRAGPYTEPVKSSPSLLTLFLYDM